MKPEILNSQNINFNLQDNYYKISLNLTIQNILFPTKCLFYEQFQ